MLMSCPVELLGTSWVLFAGKSSPDWARYQGHLVGSGPGPRLLQTRGEPEASAEHLCMGISGPYRLDFLDGAKCLT